MFRYPERKREKNDGDDDNNNNDNVGSGRCKIALRHQHKSYYRTHAQLLGIIHLLRALRTLLKNRLININYSFGPEFYASVQL